MIAAERTGRRCRAPELDPGYADTAIRRWQAFTGEKARHATGRDFDDLAREAKAVLFCLRRSGRELIEDEARASAIHYPHTPDVKAWIIMGERDPAEAVEVLDLLLKFFGNGERWVRGRLSDRRGNRCLVGALDFVSSHDAIQSDEAERYLADEISAAADCNDDSGDSARFRASLRRALSGGRYRVSETILRRDSLSDFNDGCKDFAELRAVILQALAAAMNDADALPVPHGRLDIDADKFVMA